MKTAPSEKRTDIQLSTRSFFTALQSWFKAENHGRYLGLILAEIAKYQPRAIADLLQAGLRVPGSELKSLRVETEWSFFTSAGRRQADLAVYRDGEDEPFALVEIKYRDKPGKASGFKPDQFNDYRAWVLEEPLRRKVLVLSRETLRPPAPLHALRWTEAAAALRKHASASDIVRSLIEHLKEDGLVMETIDPAALIGFLKRLLCPPRGVGQLAGNLDGPEEFAKLLRNMKIFSGRFSTDFKEAWVMASKNDEEARKTKIATIDFEVCNYLSTRVERRVFDGDTLWVQPSAKDGGSVEVFARHSLGSLRAEWMRVGYKIVFDVDSKNSVKAANLPKVKLTAFANGAAFSEPLVVRAGTIPFEKLTRKAEESTIYIERQVTEALLQVFQKIVEDRYVITSVQKRALKELSKRFKLRLGDREME